MCGSESGLRRVSVCEGVEERVILGGAVCVREWKWEWS